MKYVTKLNIKHGDLLMKSFHDSLEDGTRKWVTSYSRNKSFSSLSSLIRSFRINWDPIFDYEGDPFTFIDEEFPMPSNDQNTSQVPSEESIEEKVKSYLHNEEPMVTDSSSNQINQSIPIYENQSLEIPLREESLNSFEDVHKENPQVIIEESPLDETLIAPFQTVESPHTYVPSTHQIEDPPFDHPSCPQSIKIEIHESSTISLEDEDTSDEMFELGDGDVSLSSISSQESSLCIEYSLNTNSHDWDFLGNPIHDTSNDGGILSDILDQQSLGEELEEGSHLHIEESPNDNNFTLERDTYDGFEYLFSNAKGNQCQHNLGETIEEQLHMNIDQITKENQGHIILEHLYVELYSFGSYFVVCN